MLHRLLQKQEQKLMQILRLKLHKNVTQVATKTEKENEWVSIFNEMFKIYFVDYSVLHIYGNEWPYLNLSHISMWQVPTFSLRNRLMCYHFSLLYTQRISLKNCWIFLIFPPENLINTILIIWWHFLHMDIFIFYLFVMHIKSTKSAVISSWKFSFWKFEGFLDILDVAPFD